MTGRVCEPDQAEEKGRQQMRDTYDPDDEILADLNAHPIRKWYAEINIGIRDRGEKWTKCLTCGAPFQFAAAGPTPLFCDDICEAGYVIEFR